ncbi:MAG TPA: penicillin-binding protein activator [Rhodanobacteraceae bacterium]|nr:penicillin-binding protein activator [Rhodanobacteraceae bacterium]
MRPILLSSLLLVLALTGCATTVSVPTPQQRAQEQHAGQLFSNGQYAQAAQAYLALAAQYRASRDHFRLRAAEAWRESGSLPQATQVLDRVDRDRLSPVDARQYDLLKAEAAMAQGNPGPALRLAGNQNNPLPAPWHQRALELRAKAQAATGQPWQAARTRVTLDPLLTGIDRERNSQRILTLLSGLGADALKQRIDTMSPNDPMYRWLAQALGQMGVPVAQAAPQLAQPVGTLLPGGNQAEGYRMPRQVALLLPVSGPLAAAGNAIRQGFFAAYFQAGHGLDPLPPVKVYDTAGTADGALAAYQQAVADGASLVVGPLTREGVSAIVAQPVLPAEILALNRPDGQAMPPPRVTEFALRPEAEGIQAARHMFQRGLTQAVVMTSGDSSAQRAADAFKIQFEGLGGHVTIMLTLDPAVVNYAPQIQSLHLGQQPEGTTDTTPVPDAGVNTNPHTGIFLSMRPEQARLLMPQLRLAAVKLPVFATSHVYGGEDNPVADGDLDGVEFCDAPWLFNAQPGLPSRAAVATLLASARGTSGRFFAFGMDAWSLVPYLDWLRTHTGSYLPGATGRLSEDGFGHVHRTLIWASFDHGLAHPLDGNLQLGAPVMQPAPAGRAPTPQMPSPTDDIQPPLPAHAGSVPADDGY